MIRTRLLMRTGLSKCGMGVSSRSAIVLEFDWPLRSRRASYSLGARLILGSDFGERLYRRFEKATGSLEFGNKESSSHVGTYTITIKAKAENPDSKASPFCAIKKLAPILKEMIHSMKLT